MVQTGTNVPDLALYCSKVTLFGPHLEGCGGIKNLPQPLLGKEGSHAAREMNLHQTEVLNALTAHPRYVYRIRRTRRMTRRPAEKAVA